MNYLKKKIILGHDSSFLKFLWSGLRINTRARKEASKTSDNSRSNNTSKIESHLLKHKFILFHQKKTPM